MTKKTSRKSLFIRLCKYVAKYWYLFIPAVITALVSNHLCLMAPMYSGIAIDAISNSHGINFVTVWNCVDKMLICYILSQLILPYAESLLLLFMSQKIMFNLRRQLFEKLTRLPVNFFDRHTTGDVISRISYDVDTINSMLSYDLLQILASTYSVIGSLLFMWNISKPLIVVFVVTFPISILLTIYRSKRIRPRFSKRSKKLGELNGFAEEMLSGCRTIQAYAAEKEISGRFNRKNQETMDAYYDADYYESTLGPSVGFVGNLSISLIMILGGMLYLFSQNNIVQNTSLFFITLGGIAQFVQYARKFAGPITEFANNFNQFQSAFAAADRVFAIIDESPEQADIPDAVALDALTGEVLLKDVSFGYTPDKEILHKISLSAQPGKTIAIVGPTGSGKTTIINLLMRFYDVNTGTIFIDGSDIQHITRSSLRHAYTMVLQDTWLFEDTIFKNIAYGRDGATLSDVKKAAKAAKIDDFIESLPDGYDTVLTDGGINISKGQKQLLTIARAMISDSQMLILDEATSNVDSLTEIKIQEAMKELMQDRTCFVIAHRLSTIHNADLILVLQDGEITEAGNHDELMSKGGFYSTLYNSQFD